MKHTIASLFFFALSFCFSLTAQAQKVATWKGGTPGKAVEWSCASNWKEGSVPNEFSDVIIPDVSAAGGFQPVINKTVEGVNSLTVMPGARLRIETSGAIEIYESLELIAGNALQNYGRLDAPMSDTHRNKQDAALASQQ